METKDHFHLAKLITSQKDFIKSAERTAFEYGCISPDINPFSYIKGHKYHTTIADVKRAIEKLHGQLKTPVDYFRLGSAVHYIGDYFTFPHTPFFKGTLSEHLGYEKKLHDYIMKQRDGLENFSFDEFSGAEKCIGLLDKLQKKYYDIKHSISSDWNYIRLACAGIALSSVRESRGQEYRLNHQLQNTKGRPMVYPMK